MQIKKHLVVIIIVLIFVAIFAGFATMYYWILIEAKLPLFIPILVIIAFLGIISAVIKVGLDRVREINKESKDDLSKY